MGESVQAVAAAVFLFGAIGSVLAWGLDGSPAWARFGVPSVTLGALGLLVWSMARPDKVPDYLRRLTRRAFDRDGFSFTVLTRVVNGRCFLLIAFQNRLDRPCRARLALKPAKGFFLMRPDAPGLSVVVDCPAAGFGVARVPRGVPDQFQGKTMKLDVAADVLYPEGAGTLVRYRGGLAVGGTGFSHWNAALTVASALTGQIHLSQPAAVTLRLPTGVFETVPDDAPVSVEILWKAGDDPMRVDPNRITAAAVV